MSSKQLSVTLSLFYGVATYNAKGDITSKHESVTITQGSSEWDNFMKHLKANGITEIKVTKAYDLNKVNKDEPTDSEKRYEEVKDIESIQAEVDKYFTAPEIALTPEQKELKELREMVEALKGGNNSTAINKVVSTENSDALKTARADYEKVVGKKAGVQWDVAQINSKKEEFEVLETARADYKKAFDKDADEALTLEEIKKAINEKQ